MVRCIVGVCCLLVVGAGCPDGIEPDADAGPVFDGGVGDAGPVQILAYAEGTVLGEGASPVLLSARPGWTTVNLPPALMQDGEVEVVLDVADDVRSALLVYSGPPGSRVLVTRLEAPDGSLLVDDVDPPDTVEGDHVLARGFYAQLASPARSLPQEVEGAYFIPNTPDVIFAPGRYRARIGAFDVDDNVAVPRNGTLAVSALVDTRAPAMAHVLEVEIHLYTDAWRAETIEDDAVAAEALSRWQAIYAQVGITLNFSFRNEDPEAFGVVALVDESCDIGELGDLFEQSESADADKLQLFVIDTFFCEIGGFDVGRGIAGIAGGIPSTLPALGLSHSGVAVALSFFSEAPDRIGAVMAHESGHALGLFHTKERSRPGQREVYDIVSDTPETEPGVLENLMYFLAQDETTLTDGQGEVMRRHPLVQPLP